jgi:membrane associated rhomboid family serine protease
MTPLVRVFLGLNFGVYLLSTVDRTLHYYFLDQWFSLIPLAVTAGFQVWRLVTYMFLHAPTPLHILFNMFILWMFGPEVERVLGRRRFVVYYFITGIGAGLCSYAINPWSINPVEGASGAMYGLLLAFALFFPNRELLLFFVIPIKAKYLVVGLAVMELLFSLSSSSDGIAHAAHLGGLLFGLAYLKRRTLLPDMKYHWLRLRGWWYRRKFKVYTSPKKPPRDRWPVN